MILSPKISILPQSLEEYIDDIDINYKTPKDNFLGTFIGRILTLQLSQLNGEIPKEVTIEIEIDGNSKKQPSFIISQPNKDEISEEAELKGYDYSIKFDVPFDSSIIQFPCTNLELAQAICDYCGVELENVDFINSNFIITSQKVDSKNNCREIIGMIACDAAGIAFMNENNKVEIRSITETDIVIDDIFEHKFTQKIGPINSVVIAREPISDYIVLKDDESISNNGLTEMKITNNVLIDDNREEAIIPIFNKLNGIEFICATIETYEGFKVKPFDLVTINNQKVLVTNINIKYPNILDGSIGSEQLTKTESNYKIAKGIEKRLINAEAKVDKVTGEIILLSKQQKTDKLELQQAIGATEEEFSKFVDETYKQQINSLQAQVDGQIMSFFYDYEPTLSNIPASEWIDEEEKIKHMGDLFYNSSNGLAYRFSYIDNQWIWVEIQDTDVGKAIANAENALNVANNKKRVFTIQPTPPYDVGDLWITDTKELKSCIVAKENGSYEETDWQDFVYTEKINEATEAVNIIEETVTNLKLETDRINATVSETVSKLNNDYLTAEQIEAENATMKEGLEIIKQQQASMELKSTGLQIQIDTINNEGVKTVKNTTVDINENGVTVGKSDSEFSTNMNNTGTYMYAYGKQIAKYDKDGVETANFKATGEVELGYLKLIKAEVNGEKRTHIHFIGG